MRQVNIVLDLYSGGICMILFLYLLFARGRHDKLRFYFMLMCIFNFLMALSDTTNWMFEGTARPWYPVALQTGSLFYYLCSGPLLLAFTGYLMEYLAPKVKVKRGFWYGAAALCAFQMGGSILSLWNGMFYGVAEGNLYQRGSLFWLSQLLPLMIYSLDGAMLFYYRRYLKKKDIFILSSYIFLPLVVESIQMMNYGIALLNTGAAASILFIFIGIQSVRELRMEQQEKELAEARIDIMLSQIQPHFLYNSLTAIRRLCDKDPQAAKKAIQDFALFLRANMDSLKSKSPIPFEQELVHVESYLALELQRFQNRLHVVYDIPCRDFSIPPLTLQPIVENAVRHGVLRREEGGTVTISTRETENAWLIIVKDDGVGIGAPDHTETCSHIGIDNVRARLEALCRGTLVLESTAGAGTTAAITIPKEEITP